MPFIKPLIYEYGYAPGLNEIDMLILQNLFVSSRVSYKINCIRFDVHACFLFGVISVVWICWVV